jgi:tryptophan synthase alpha chain
VQEADQRALAKKINTDRNFELIRKIRAYDEKIPISLLVYYNLIFQRGIRRFYRDANEAGVDAVLAADCPLEEATPLLRASKRFKINQVFLVAPTTTKERTARIVEHASGYVYLVSLLGVTGARATLQKRTIALIKKARAHTKLPLCVGFGISRPAHVKAVLAAGADGVIVGSAVIDLIKKNIGKEERMLRAVGEYAAKMKKATKMGGAP